MKITAQQFDAWADFQMKRLGNDLKLAVISWQFADIQHKTELRKIEIEIEDAQRRHEYCKRMAELSRNLTITQNQKTP